MTHNEMIQAGRDLTGDVAGTGRDVPTWQRLFNLEQDEFSDEVPSAYELDSTHILAPGASAIALPDDFILSTIPKVAVAGVDLDYIAPEKLPPTGDGPPALYSVFGREIRFDTRVATTTTFEVRSARRPPAVVGAGSAPVIDPEWHRGIFYGGLSKAFFADRNETQGLYYREKAQDVRDRAARASSTRHRQRRRKEDF